MKPTPQPKIEGWFRQLDEGRIEIFLKVEFRDQPTRKIRSSGPEAEMFELVEWFEQKTGLRVDSPTWRRVRTGPKPLEGQASLLDATPEPDSELPSGATLL